MAKKKTYIERRTFPKNDPSRDDKGNLRPEYIRALRQTVGLTQEDCANLVHVTARTWRKWEQDEKQGSHRRVPEMAIELFCLKAQIKYPPRFYQAPTVEETKETGDDETPPVDEVKSATG
jgi:transcriptional regulator with XRE-family HTH domain